MNELIYTAFGFALGIAAMFIAIFNGWIGRIDPVSPAQRQALRDSRRVLREANQTRQ